MNKSQKIIHNIYHFDHFEYSDSHIILFTSLKMYLCWVFFETGIIFKFNLNKRVLLNKV